MRTTHVRLLGMLMLGAAITFGACSKDKENGPEEEQTDENTIEVEFADAEFADFIKEELELEVSAKITRGDLKGLTTLNIRGQLPDVEDLTGLEYATELDTLDFGNTKVSDLTPIKDLKKIKYLRFNETPVTDLTPIKDYTTLTYFNANQASPGLTSIAALGKNTNLGTLILRGNPLGDEGIAVIAKFTKLHRLNARSTEIGDATVAILAELMSKGALLKTTVGYEEGDSELDLRGNSSITDWAPIEAYSTTSIPVSK